MMATDCTPQTVAGLVRLGQELSPAKPLTGHYDVHGVTTRVETNSETIAAAVAKLLKPFAVSEVDRPDIRAHLFAVDALQEEMAPVPAAASLMYNWGEVTILHQGSCRYLSVEGRARVAADIELMTVAGFAGREMMTSDWLISNVFFYPLWGQLIKEAGLFPLHAAGLTSQGKAYLFLGRSGSGKSTITINLIRAGYGLLSDDTVFLRLRDGRVEALSFPEEINVDEKTMELLPELSRVENFTVNELRQKSSFSIEELYPGRVVDSSAPAVMMFPEITNSEATVVAPMSRTEALALVMRYGFFFLDPSTTARHFEILSQLARQTDCFHLYSGRDQEQLERTINSLLTKERKPTGEEGND